MNPKVSIIIITRNRAAHLRETLVAFQRLQVPRELPAELLVVDNASTDDTAAVIRAAQLPQLPVRYLLEPRRGLSNGRNSGLAHTTGELILFTDDDVRVPENWIANLTAPLLSGAADAVAGGVRLAPHLERPWMTPMHRSALACTKEREKQPPHELIGANMAFTRAVIRRVPGFDPELGAGALGFKEESLFFKQFQKAGFRLAKQWGLPVEHHFEPNRLLHASFVDTARRRGHSDAYLRHHWSHETVENLAGRTREAAARLAWYRLLHPGNIFLKEGCADWEMSLVRKLHFFRHMAVEQKRPRNYDFEGLIKKDNAPAVSAPAATPETAGKEAR
ncbi:MAG TPA: glycosyltransferase family A protein [Dongiaceae bacterium]|nr:glycosyltransferase family A protein [Dongiaceae bacterium]